MHRALDSLSSAGGGAMVITGDAGIGKSRLVEEARAYAVTGNTLVLEGGCFPHDRGYPYAPLIELLRAHFATRTAEAIRSAIGPFEHEFAALLPEMVALGGTPPPVAAGLESDGRRLVAALTRWFMATAQDQPVLVIIEDLHWCDDASLDAFFSLARAARDMPLLLLITLRPDEQDGRLRDWLAQLHRGRLATELPLAPLPDEDAALLMRLTAGPEITLPRDVVAGIAALAEGNPFCVEELTRSCLSLVAEPAPAVGAGTSGTPSPPLPRSLQIAVLQRVERLSPMAREALRVAAVAGRRFDFDLIKSLVRVDEPALFALLHELVDAGLVVEEARDRFAFRHALGRQAVINELLARERVALHQRVAQLLESRIGTASDGRISDLAYHFYEGEQWPEAARYGAAAGVHARRLHAPHAAIEHFSRALIAAARLTAALGAAAGLPQSVVAGLHRDRARAYETVGDFESARQDCEAALALARSASDRQLELHILLDSGRLWQGRDFRRTGEYYEAALALARTLDNPSLLAQALNCMGEWYANTKDDPWAARPLHEEALALFTHLGDRHGLALTLKYLSIVHYQGSDLPGAIPYAGRAADLFRQLGQQRGLVAALTMLGTRAGATDVNPVTAPTADFAGGVHDGEEAIRIAREIGWRPGEALGLFMLAVVLVEQGYYARALELGRRSLALAEEMGHRHWLAGANCTLGSLHTELLALPAAIEYLSRGHQLAQGVGSTVWQGLTTTGLGRAYLRAGDLDRAAAVLGPVPDPDQPIPAMSRRMLAHVHARLAVARNEPHVALRLLDRLESPPAAGIVRYDNPHLGLTRAEALILLGQTAEAEALLGRVQAAATRAGSRPLLWRAQATLGGLYRARGLPDRARREFTAARSVIEHLAAGLPDEELRTTFLEHATAQLPRAYRLAPGRTVAVQFDGLTAREREIATLVGRRATNREIANALTLAERTVETHVSNILNKLGMDSRVQIAAWAAAKGLVSNLA